MMATTFVYRNLPAFFSALQEKVRKNRKSLLLPYFDEKKNRVGFYDGPDTLCVDVKTARDYYMVVHQGERLPEKEAQMFIRDIMSIINSKDKMWN